MFVLRAMDWYTLVLYGVCFHRHLSSPNFVHVFVSFTSVSFPATVIFPSPALNDPI